MLRVEKTDEELMVAYQRGELGAFERIYRRHAPRIHSFLRRRTQDESLAEEIFQATFLKLHRTRGRYQARYPFLPWLFMICRNEWVDVIRRTSTKAEVALPEIPAETVSDKIETDLSALSPEQQKVLRMRYEQDFSFDEIAKQLKTTPGNIRQKVSRAIRKLRERS